MKNISLVALLLALYLSATAQKIRFTDTSNHWEWYIHNCPDTSSGTITPLAFTGGYSGDTTIFGQTYKRWTSDNWIVGMFIREDTIANKVYLRHSLIGGTPLDTGEHLLLDYTLQLNDTFKFDYGDPTNPSIYYVDNFDSTVINSTWHKVWHFQKVNPVAYLPDYYVIEGIGSLFDPLFPIFWLDNVDYCNSVTCFHNNGIVPPLSHVVAGYFDNNTSCSLSFIPSAIKSLTGRNESSILFPNPVNESSKIVFPYNITSGTLLVVNDIGQPVINISFQNKEEVLIGSDIKVPGIYYYRVIDNISGDVFSGKFVSQ